MNKWEDLKPRFRSLTFQRGVTEIAREIPASRQSVYNWADGDTRPNRTAQARIQEILKEQESE